MAQKKKIVWIVAGIVGIIVTVFILISTGVIKIKKTIAIWFVFLPSSYRSVTQYVVQMAKVETDDFTSRIYRDDHNMFGMGIAEQRDQLREGIDANGEGGRPVAIYRDDVQSAQDLLKWFQYHDDDPSDFNESDATFVKYVKSKGFFESDEASYLARMRNFA